MSAGVMDLLNSLFTIIISGLKEGKRRRGIEEIPEESCPTSEEDRVTRGTELNGGTDS
jgi:hypothetical protein